MTPLLNLLVVLATALATALSVPRSAGVSPPRCGGFSSEVRDLPPQTDRDGLLRRGRWAWSSLAGVGAGLVLGGPLAVPAGVAAAAGVWVVAGRLEPAAVRRRREEVRRDLPHVVTLLAAALRSGLAPVDAIGLVSRALPGAAADRLAPVATRLRLGGDVVPIWAALAADPDLGSLGRTLARAHRTGAPVVAAVERLGVELARRGRAEVEDRARAVGVRAAVPLGLCLLPSFLLLGIVPLAVSLAAVIV
ncbi:type II secretion system protein [Nocardioides sp. Root614]|nr:type II secretion system protein [Nocardioides sp. Root614]KRA87010.1 type II secretion system protein [Nocardioides sp. Root682]